MSYRRMIYLGALVAVGFAFVSSDASAARRGGVYRAPNGGAVAWRGEPAPYRAYWRPGWGPAGLGYYYNYNAPPCGYDWYPPCY
jgi:hypothetical protein